MHVSQTLLVTMAVGHCLEYYRGGHLDASSTAGADELLLFSLLMLIFCVYFLSAQLFPPFFSDFRVLCVHPGCILRENLDARPKEGPILLRNEGSGGGTARTENYK